MPKVSIIVPCYNSEDTIAETLESICAQTLSDIEAILVDDGSTDKSPAILAEYAQRDSRFKLVTQENRGLHLARKTGVDNASGEYSLFLDADDTLSSDTCEILSERLDVNPVDILHFGVESFPESSDYKTAATDFDKFANSNIGYLEGDAIQNTIFDECFGYQLDWRTWQRIFPTPFLKKAFSAMSSSRLERAEDSHEGLVLACLAQTFDSMDDHKGYRYTFGKGISTRKNINAETFGTFCDQFLACLEASKDFAAANPNLVSASCLAGLEAKCIELLANDWLDRVPDNAKEESIGHLERVFGSAVAARELLRFARDRSYNLLKSETVPSDDDLLYLFLRLASAICEVPDTSAAGIRLANMRSIVATHLRDLKQLQNSTCETESGLKIFVAAHDTFEYPPDPIFKPVQVGSAQFDENQRMRTTLHDGDGLNISKANPRYCEMTVQYWAWKNVQAEYYGFCHYRRYFNFSGIDAKESDWGEVEVESLSPEVIERFGLNEKSALACIGDADVLCTKINDVSRFPDKNPSVYEHYRNAPSLHIEDLNTLIDVIAELEPDYLADAESYLSGSRSCFCNMYIMKRDAFHKYCAWLFPLLEEFENRADMSLYNMQELRVTGHLAERLFNIYLLHNQRQGSGAWKVREAQCVRVENPRPLYPLTPAFPNSPLPAIPVVFAADNNYSPMLATAISSLIANSSDSRYYDIVVLSRGIDWRNQQRMVQLCADKRNVSLRFFDVGRLVGGYKLTVNEHITEETYYRFLIQWILGCYPKVLYLDSDLIVDADVAELFDTELGENLLAAVVDVDWAGICRRPELGRVEYAKRELGMKDPYSYFQAGVLLLNTAKMAKLHSLEDWLALAATPRKYNDQDVLNQECEGRVTYLDLTWNMLVDTGRLEVAIQHAPAHLHQAYLDSREHPRIIHYAGAIKPWDTPDCDFGQTFWEYARRTPFYEDLIKRLIARTIDLDWPYRHDLFLIEQGSRSAIRKVADVVLPYGSRRRETLRTLAGIE